MPDRQQGARSTRAGRRAPGAECIVRTSARTSIVPLLSERAAASPHARAFTFLDGGEVERSSAPGARPPRTPPRTERAVGSPPERSGDHGVPASDGAGGSAGAEPPGSSMTWSALDERTRAIGAAIASRVPAGARVLLLFPPGLDIIPAFFGALAAGSIAIPVYPPAGARMDRTVVRLRGMIADAGVTLVVSTNAVRVKADAFSAVIPELSKVSWLAV